MNNRIVQIQSLKIAPGWFMSYNQFYDIDPLSLDPQDENTWVTYFEQSLLQMKHWRYPYILDLGWYPYWEPKGSFGLELIKNFDWQNPVVCFSTRNKQEVVDQIECILHDVTTGKYGTEEWQSPPFEWVLRGN